MIPKSFKVKVWFQNRRTKQKRVKTDGEEDDDDEEDDEENTGDEELLSYNEDEDDERQPVSSNDSKQAKNGSIKRKHPNKHNNSNQSTNDSACSSDIDLDVIADNQKNQKINDDQQPTANPKAFLAFNQDYNLWNDSLLMSKNLASNLGVH